jgi:Transposase DDE domain
LINKLSKVLSEKEIIRVAMETGFVKRKSKKVDALKFVKMVLLDQLQYDQPSLQQHAFELETEKGVKISKQGIDKRFKPSAVALMENLFERYLAHAISYDVIATKLKDKYAAVRIMDSTEFKLPDCLAKHFPGYSASNALACAAIQFEYDVLSKSINCMSVENAKVSDKTYADKRMENIKKNELIIRDLGYYSIDSYQKIEKQEAFYISRLKSQISIFEQNKKGIYKELTLSEIIKRIKQSGNAYLDQTVYIGSEQKKQVRLMTWLLDEQAQKKRLQKKKSRKGKINNDDVLWSKLNVFITNVPCQEISVQEAYDLYKIRWQIELIFKVWKSILKIHLVRKMKPDRFKCYLYGKLLWVLLCWDITASFEPVIWKQKKELISLYKCYALLKNKARQLGSILFHANEKLKEWLSNMLNYFSDFGLKENKKGRKKIIELLRFTQK